MNECDHNWLSEVGTVRQNVSSYRWIVVNHPVIQVEIDICILCGEARSRNTNICGTPEQVYDALTDIWGTKKLKAAGLDV